MLRSISKQSGESLESVRKTQRTAILVETLKFRPSNLTFSYKTSLQRVQKKRAQSIFGSNVIPLLADEQVKK